MIISRTRAIARALPIWIPVLPHRGLFEIPETRSGDINGANISQLLLSASRFLHLLFLVDEGSFQKALGILFRPRCKDALTKNFVLSNTRFVPWGARRTIEGLAMFAYEA